jgi:ABC-type amino acid transport substrate-binding protein
MFHFSGFLTALLAFVSPLAAAQTSTVASPATAAAAAAPQPVLERIKAGGKLIIAHREASIPFSYYDADKKPVGYAMDLCLKLADSIKKAAGVKDMPIEYLMVTSGNRIQMIAEGKADMECGSTTNNKDRREKVAFTIPHFITGARLLVKSSASIERLEDLKGKSLAANKGSTPMKAVETANKERLIGIKIVETPDVAKSIEMLVKDEVQAFTTDDVLLYAQAASQSDPKSLKVVGKFMTTEPLAIMLPKNDPAFKKVVDEEMKRLIRSREAYAIYSKWFEKPIPPKNINLALPASYLLKDFWKYPTDVVPN